MNWNFFYVNYLASNDSGTSCCRMVNDREAGFDRNTSIVYHGSVLGRLAGKRGELAWVFELATLYGGRFERGPGRC